MTQVHYVNALKEDKALAGIAREFATLEASSQAIGLSRVISACMAIGRAYAVASQPIAGSNIARELTVTKTEIAETLQSLGAGKASTFQAYLGLADALCGMQGRGKARAPRNAGLHIAAVLGERAKVEELVSAIGRTVADLRLALSGNKEGKGTQEADPAKKDAARAKRVEESLGSFHSVDAAIAAIIAGAKAADFLPALKAAIKKA